MLVSGVRSSCEASATNSRWRASDDSVSPRAALSSRSISSSVWARSATSSLASEAGSLTSGSRVRATSLRGAREAGDRAHRPARDEQPAEEGQQRAAEHAEGEEQPHAGDRARHRDLGLGVLQVGDDAGPQRAGRRLEQALLLAHGLDQRP